MYSSYHNLVEIHQSEVFACILHDILTQPEKVLATTRTFQKSNAYPWISAHGIDHDRKLRRIFASNAWHF